MMRLFCGVVSDDLNTFAYDATVAGLGYNLEFADNLTMTDYKNFTREEPWSVGQYYLSQLMLRKSWHLSEYIKVLENMPDILAMSKAVRKALSHVQVDMLVHGNATEDGARELAEIFCANLKRLGTTPLQELRKKEVTKLPKSTTVFEFDLAALNPAQDGGDSDPS
eukprot:g13210.t1